MKKIAMSEIREFFTEPKRAYEFQQKFQLSNQESKNAMRALEDGLFIDQVSLNPGETFQWNFKRSHETDGTLKYHLNLKEDYDDFFKESEPKDDESFVW